MVKITRENAFRLNNVLKSLKDIKSTKFAYMVCKNTRVIDAEFEIFKELADKGVPESFKDFEKEKIDIIQKFASKDENGNFKSLNNNYVFEGENEKLLHEEFNELSVKYAETLSQNELNNIKVAEIAKEEIEVNLLKIKFEELPDDLNAEQFDALEPIIISQE